jgi:uncharacterized protein (TIGR02270 family)
MWHIVKQSFSEAEFLWGRWEAALDSHRHTLRDVGFWVEERLLGAIDGIALGGARAVDELLRPAIEGRRRRPATAAAYVLSSMGRDGDEALFAAMRTATPERVDDLARGMELTDDPHAPERWFLRVRELPPAGQAAIIRVFAYRQLAAPPGMDTIVDGRALAVQCQCLALAGTTRAPWARPYIDWGLERSNPALRIAAARSGMILGIRRARHVAREVIEAGVDGAEELLVPIALGYGEPALPLVLDRLRRVGPSRAAFEALTAIGTVVAGDTCAQLLQEGVAPVLAAEALRAIAGSEIEAPGTFEEDDDGGLPRPHTDALLEQWKRLRAAYRNRERYFVGHPLRPDELGVALQSATTRRRHLLAADLALRTGGLGRVSTNAWTAVQRAQMTAVTPRPS